MVEECERNRRGSKGKRKGWWDGECKEEKGELRRALRRWRRRGGKGEEYRELSRKYKELCGKKKEEEREREMGKRDRGSENIGEGMGIGK